MENLRKTISRNLVELRKRNNFTQSELAAILKYSDKAVSKWESGESLPDVEVLYTICKIYNVSFEYILSEGSYEDKQNLVYKQNGINKLIISLLSITLVFFIILLVYIYLSVFAGINLWILFFWALPISSLLVLIFNSVWGRPRLNYMIISIMIWTFLTAMYLTVLTQGGLNLWHIYVVGVPAQVAIILWSQLK